MLKKQLFHQRKERKYIKENILRKYYKMELYKISKNIKQFNCIEVCDKKID